MSAPAATARFLEGIRLTEHERGLLIEQMKKSGVVERRKNPRLIVDGSLAMLITMDSPGGSSACFRIYPWDISRGGVGFFHRSFVYPGTRCTMSGVARSGSPFSITGEVIRCSHVSGNVHAVGVKLDSEIEPEELVGTEESGTPGTAGAPAPDDWWTKLGSLTVELARLSRERASTDAVRTCVANLGAHVRTQPEDSARPDSPHTGA